MSDFITEEFIIGEIVNVQGLKGEVRVFPRTDDPTRFELLNEVSLNLRGAALSYRLEKAWQRPPFVILKFVGFDTREAAENLRGAVITVKREQALPCGEDEYYVADLIGCGVYLPDDMCIGKIANVITTGANDVYEVLGIGEDEFILIPAIRQCIKRVDIKGRRVYVELLQGLEWQKKPSKQ